ncbi:hypothetical protein NJC08_05030 [Pseudomonas fluorescens]|uniref:hypothetical protein n=1 Tax=Pseudomonas TaxID=286 RepID=UPI001179AC09|nr:MULTISPECIES: hypothetical protein [Pseudomonas]MCO7625774.1 hypothetical protein [Pseudomonas fluorescens]
MDIEGVTGIFNRPVIKKMLLQFVNFSNICPAFTTTVYAFLNPKLPSAAWDFFCLRFGESRFLSPGFQCEAFQPHYRVRAKPVFFDYY